MNQRFSFSTNKVMIELKDLLFNLLKLTKNISMFVFQPMDPCLFIILVDNSMEIGIIDILKHQPRHFGFLH